MWHGNAPGQATLQSAFVSDLLASAPATLCLSRVYIDGAEISDNFIVEPRLSDEVIIGANTLRKWRIKLDLENERVIIDKRMARLLLA